MGIFSFLHELRLDNPNPNSINNNPDSGDVQSYADTILADPISYHNSNIYQPFDDNPDSVEQSLCITNPDNVQEIKINATPVFVIDEISMNHKCEC